MNPPAHTGMRPSTKFGINPKPAWRNAAILALVSKFR